MRIGGLLLAFLLLCPSAPAVASGTAMAPLTGIERVTALSAFDSTGVKGVQVSCPAGKQVIGASGLLTMNSAAQGRVIMTEAIPDTALTSVTAFAWEDQTATTGNWSIKAAAVCASALSSLVRVSASSAYDSSRSKSQVASCPPHKWLLGAGRLIEGAEGQVLLDRIEFSANLRSVTVGATEGQNGTSENWRVRAYAICGSVPPGHELVTATSAATSDDKGRSVTCPSGKEAISAGGAVIGGDGQVALGNLVPGLSSPALAVAWAWEDHDGTAAAWSVRGQGMCVSV
ncbi:hypothetical protein GCM10009555_063080 [Acrocarpospora macrocephala]|uniref:Uncharacterized protein n=1 Tax=Acrocarpospora macrocephala TaxID=150177 RepID=A0A5M3WFC2_9ACTN|nr:hypothetical protein [Acrocarpospora macrocephala]GES07757.1 hypothetical protein Amac_013520 [Acrocarpospora macrocephala]